jgi:hypothetical protein
MTPQTYRVACAKCQKESPELNNTHEVTICHKWMTRVTPKGAQLIVDFLCPECSPPCS